MRDESVCKIFGHMIAQDLIGDFFAYKIYELTPPPTHTHHPPQHLENIKDVFK